MHRLFIFLALPNLCFGAALSLSEAVDYALLHSPHLAIQQQQKEIAALTLETTQAGLFPSLDVSATHGVLKSSPPNPSDPWQSGLYGVLNENIYDNGVTFTQIEISKINKQIAGLNLLQAREKIVLDVANEFYNYSLAEQIVGLKAQQLKMLEIQLQTVEGQYKDGIRTRQDYLRFKTQTQRADIDRRNAINDRERSRVNLEQLLGVPPPEQNRLTFQAMTPDPKLEKEDFSTLPAVNQTYQVKIAKATASLAPLNVTLSEKKYWPQLLLGANINYSNNGYLGFGQPFESTAYTGGSISLTLNYNIWDWGIRRRDVEIQRVNQQIQDNTLRKVQLGTSQEIRSLMIDISQTQDNYQLTKELVSLDQESTNLLTQRYQEGTVAYLDLITGMNDLLDSKTRYFTSYFSLAQNLAKYRYYQGALYESVTAKKS